MNVRMCMNAGVYKCVCVFECMDVWIEGCLNIVMFECVNV